MNTPLKKASILLSLIVMATLSLKCDHKAEPEIIASTEIIQEKTDFNIDEDVVLREFLGTNILCPIFMNDESLILFKAIN